MKSYCIRNLVIVRGACATDRGRLRSWLVLSGLGLLPLLASAQGAGGPATVVKKTLLQELNLPAIWFLVGCSLLIVWFVVDVYLRSAPKQLLPSTDVDRLRSRFQRGDYQGAFDDCGQRPGLLHDVVRAALRHAADGRRASEEAAGHALNGGMARLQTRIAYLSVIGVIAPMVGLTGTVLGMIDAFALMGQAGASDPSKLSGAIGHVLHATAGGLIVAIPAFVFYYLLRNRVGQGLHAVASTVTELFRAFPYEDLARVGIRGAEPCAARPQEKIAESGGTPLPSPAA